MSDVIDRAAEIIESNLWVDGEHLAQALDDAELLATTEHDAEQREIGAAAVTDLIRASAIGSRARGDGDRERTLLDLLALIERTKP